MKPYPTSRLLASGLLVLTFINATQAQELSPKNSSSNNPNSSTAIACFAQVKERVLAGNSGLKSQTAMLRSLNAQTQQASLLPNPVVSFEAENFGGSRSDDDIEYTGSVSQLIETGGKRRTRTSFANATAEAFALRREIQTAELLAKAQVLHAEVLAAKTRVSLSEDDVAIRKNALQLISRKSSHGGTLKLEVEKAEVSLQTAKVVRDQRRQELQSAKRALVSLWGGDQADLKFAAHELRLHDPERELIVSDGLAIPKVTYASAKREAAAKAADFERALTVPDFTVSAGYRRFDATDDHAFVAGVSIPLPLFNRNQFARQGADDELRARQFDVANTQTAVNAELETRREQLRVLLREQQLLQQRVLPQTERVLSSATDAYRLGRINYLDYLDAQTTYLERRERLVTVTLSAIRNQVTIQRLSGTLLERISQMDQGECNAQ